MKNSMRQGLWGAVLALGFMTGCAGQQEGLGELDPALEQLEGGKEDGPVTAVQRSSDYQLQIAGVEAVAGDDWDLDADSELYVTVEDAQTPLCITSQLICDYKLEEAPGTLTFDDGMQRRFGGDELRDGVGFAVHMKSRNAGQELKDKLVGFTTIRIGRTGTLKIKPFGSVKSITFTVKW